MTNDPTPEVEEDIDVIRQKLEAQYRQLGRYKMDLVQKNKIIDNLQKQVVTSKENLNKTQRWLKESRSELQDKQARLQKVEGELISVYGSFSYRIGRLILSPVRLVRSLYENILSKNKKYYGDTVVQSEPETGTVNGALTNPEKSIKIDLGDQLTYHFGYHRSGWSYALTQLAQLSSSSGIYLDTFIERSFVWKEGPITPIKRPWVGIIHVPPNVPDWFRSRVSNKAVFSTSQWQESFPYCKGLFTLSDYHKKALEQYIEVPVCALKHPTPFDVNKWSPKAFDGNKTKRIIQIGWWLRKLHAIYELPESNYTKTFLRVSKDPYILELLEKEKSIHIEQGLFDPGMYETAELIDYVPDEQYDKMLMENIVFLDLYDSSANNAIIECIARETPILVNPIPPVMEYLGEEYPLYYSNYNEAIDKATDYRLVLDAHEYLKSFSIKSELTGDYFRNSLISAPFMQAYRA